MRHVLHLMQPARGGSEGGPTGRRRVAPGDPPQHASELNQVPVVRVFFYSFKCRTRCLGERRSLFPQVIASAWVLNVLRKRSPLLLDDVVLDGSPLPPALGPALLSVYRLTLGWWYHETVQVAGEAYLKFMPKRAIDAGAGFCF